MSRREIAEKMLRENDIFDVKATFVEGLLSDHYNPTNKTVNLSRKCETGPVFSATAVAAIECGYGVHTPTQYGVSHVLL